MRLTGLFFRTQVIGNLTYYDPKQYDGNSRLDTEYIAICDKNTFDCKFINM